jgi:hypothetical protein
MSENLPKTIQFSRPACFEDFFGETNKNTQTKYDTNYLQNDKNSIAKNQQEFGNRKRIKP